MLVILCQQSYWECHAPQQRLKARISANRIRKRIAHAGNLTGSIRLFQILQCLVVLSQAFINKNEVDRIDIVLFGNPLQARRCVQADPGNPCYRRELSLVIALPRWPLRTFPSARKPRPAGVEGSSHLLDRVVKPAGVIECDATARSWTTKADRVASLALLRVWLRHPAHK